MRLKPPYNGIFLPRDGSTVGQLTIAGKDSSLKLFGSQSQSVDHKSEYTDIHGTLGDGSRASLLDCLLSGETRRGVDGGDRFETEFFPHYVVVGRRFISSDEAAVSAVHYHFDNLQCLARGGRTFTTLNPTPDEARKILEADHQRREEIARRNGWPKLEFDPQVGERPELLYFSGVWEIIKCAAELGDVSLVNRTTHGSGSAAGIGIDNQVTAVIAFKSPRTLNDALGALRALHALFELVLGRRQRYRWIELELADTEEDPEGEPPQIADLHWSYCNERTYDASERTHRRDVLLDAEDRPNEFSAVLVGWLDSHAALGDPRARFATAFFSPYSIDRIVGAANMFDLLPETHAPKKKQLDEQTKASVDQCREILRRIPDDFARQSSLSALGRVGTANLRDKVLLRANIVTAVSDETFPELHLPCSHAILCRNHYVHGSDAAFDYRHCATEFAFLVDTLEFVFAVSDLIELGWDLGRWRGQGTTLSHSFGSYAHNYSDSLRRLKAVLGAESPAPS